MKRMRVDSSNLALRFYLRYGWTEEILNSCCEQGGVINSHPEDPPELAYFTLDNKKDSRFNLDKLMEYVSEVKRAFDDYPYESDREFIERMNW